MWSIDWPERIISWHEHVLRSSKTNSINSKLISFHDSEWLLHKRSQWVASRLSNSNRISALAGRTGTRLNIGQPQPRWDEGVALAREVLQSRSVALKGAQPLGIGSRIRNAVSSLREFMNGHASTSN